MYYWSKEFSGYIYWHCFGCYWVRGLYSCALPAGSPLNSRHYRGNNHNNNNSNNNNSNKNNNNNKQRPFAGGPVGSPSHRSRTSIQRLRGFCFTSGGSFPESPRGTWGSLGCPSRPDMFVRGRILEVQVRWKLCARSRSLGRWTKSPNAKGAAEGGDFFGCWIAFFQPAAQRRPQQHKQ